MANGKTSQRMGKAAILRHRVWGLYRAGMRPGEIAEQPEITCSRNHVYQIIEKQLDEIDKDMLVDVKAVFQRDFATLDHMQSKAYVKVMENGDLKAIDTIKGLCERRSKMLGYDGMLGGKEKLDKPLLLSFEIVDDAPKNE